MVSNDVEVLEPGPERSGCYATLLTNRGAIVADLHVLLRPDAFWLETRRDAIARVVATLDRFIIADDVALASLEDDRAVLGLEGPLSTALLSEVCRTPVALAAEACGDFEIDGIAVLVAAFGVSGERAYRIVVPSAGLGAVAEAVRAAGAEHGLVEGTAEALDVLRIEAGTPLLGRELDEDVLPPEARLDRAISARKGCYVGQKIVARVRARGQVNHLLVGLVADDDRPPPVDAKLVVGGKRVGEITSACRSASAGAIALGYVRREHAEPGTALACEGSEEGSEGGGLRVVALPFVAPAPERA